MCKSAVHLVAGLLHRLGEVGRVAPGEAQWEEVKKEAQRAHEFGIGAVGVGHANEEFLTVISDQALDQNLEYRQIEVKGGRLQTACGCLALGGEVGVDTDIHPVCAVFLKRHTRVHLCERQQRQRLRVLRDDSPEVVQIRIHLARLPRLTLAFREAAILQRGRKCR